ncbi:MAG: helix-turn-helix domain-containing protein [Bacilli bacterium]|nr:helix-turn-helix domain-containing protein [Bacilli bacterium]
MSQQELADLVGCSRQTINALENNRYSPSYILEKKDCLYLTLVSKR